MVGPDRSGDIKYSNTDISKTGEMLKYGEIGNRNE